MGASDMSTADLVTQHIEHLEALVECERFPEKQRYEALGLMLLRSQHVRNLTDSTIRRRAHDLSGLGYHWGRAHQFRVLPGTANKDLLELLINGAGLDTLGYAWSNAAVACMSAKLVFASSDERGATFEQVAESHIKSLGLELSDEEVAALADAFTTGAVVCAAEKELVLALDRLATRRRVRRAQRWDWLPWRRLTAPTSRSSD